MIEASPAAIFAKDLNGRYVMVNPVTARNMGMLGPILGHTDAELLPADVAVRLMATDEEVLTSGQVVAREEVLELGGETLSFQSVKTPLRDGTGQLIGLCGIATDITAYKRVERELRAANDERARLLTIAEDARSVSDALSRSKDQFVAMISHELRTPLTAVLGYLHMLQKGLVFPSGATRCSKPSIVTRRFSCN